MKRLYLIALIALLALACGAASALTPEPPTGPPPPTARNTPAPSPTHDPGNDPVTGPPPPTGWSPCDPDTEVCPTPIYLEPTRPPALPPSPTQIAPPGPGLPEPTATIDLLGLGLVVTDVGLRIRDCIEQWNAGAAVPEDVALLDCEVAAVVPRGTPMRVWEFVRTADGYGVACLDGGCVLMVAVCIDPGMSYASYVGRVASDEYLTNRAQYDAAGRPVCEVVAGW